MYDPILLLYLNIQCINNINNIHKINYIDNINYVKTDIRILHTDTDTLTFATNRQSDAAPTFILSLSLSLSLPPSLPPSISLILSLSLSLSLCLSLSVSLSLSLSLSFFLFPSLPFYLSLSLSIYLSLPLSLLLSHSLSFYTDEVPFFYSLWGFFIGAAGGENLKAFTKILFCSFSDFDARIFLTYIYKISSVVTLNNLILNQFIILFCLQYVCLSFFLIHFFVFSSIFHRKYFFLPIALIFMFTLRFKNFKNQEMTSLIHEHISFKYNNLITIFVYYFRFSFMQKHVSYLCYARLYCTSYYSL